MLTDTCCRRTGAGWLSPSHVIQQPLGLSTFRRLRPGRATKKDLASELQIGMDSMAAVFCVEGVETRCPARGDWQGFVRIPYRFIHPLVKVPPTTNPVRLAFADGRLRIASMTFAAHWVPVAGWIGRMAMEAHFLSDDKVVSERWFCPACGKKKSVRLLRLGPAAGGSQPTKTLDIQARATHQCTGCDYGWIEVGPLPGEDGQPRLA